MMRPRTLLSASLTCGSLEASIALIAQIGLSPAHFRITSQSRLVATNTFSARCTPREVGRDSLSERAHATGRAIRGRWAGCL